MRKILGGRHYARRAVAYEFRLPDLGEGLTEGEIARWLVSEGQAVAEDDPLVEIQTDKTTVEIPSPAAGTVDRILVAEGDVVPVGTALVVIADGASAPAGEEQPRAERVPQQAAAQPPLQQTVASVGSVARIRATPLVRRLADELGVDVATVAATGPLGRVTEEDVRTAAAQPASQHSVASSRIGVGAPPSEERREPLRGVRRLIAEHMTRAHREVPPVTWVEECDFSRVSLDRLVPTLLRACALSLREFPELNARLEEDEIVLLERYDLGFAVQTERGLLVPVVRRCHERPLDELAGEVERLAEGARAGTLAADELRGSTFTVTSAGKLAGPLPDADREPPGGGHPERRQGRRPARRARRRGGRRARGPRRAHVRPPRRGRRAGGGVRARRDQAPGSRDRLLLGRLRGRARVQVLLEHADDLRLAHAAVAARDDSAILDERQRGHLVDPEPLGEVRSRVHVDPVDAQPVAFHVGEMGHDALHAPRGARAFVDEEEQ